MLFADDTRAVAASWAAAFGAEQVDVEEHEQGRFVFFETGDIDGIHVADPKKNPLGAAQSSTGRSAASAPHVNNCLNAEQRANQVNDHRSICQLRDPYGQLFGLDRRP